MTINLSIDQAKAILINAGQTIIEEKRTGNNLGTLLRLSNGCIVNCWDKGTTNCQGKNATEVEKILTNTVGTIPLILDQLISSGQTIIEKLEEYTQKANFGIVLATPDDIGYPKNDDTQKRYRVRQNVVLELGMLLSRIGRDKVAILLSQAEDMERPSDIDGLLYIPFKDNVEEAKLSLAKEMQNNGYNLDIAKL